MLIDLRDLPDESVVDADICLVGAGAAGISLALALSGSHLSVCLVEAGGLRGDQATQSLTRGQNVGQPYFRLDEVRQTGFGGTTSVWAGACRPLDSVDFQQRNWVPHSGWPIDRAKLDPYYARAQEVCQLGPYAYDVDAWDPTCERRLPLPADQIQTDIFQIAPIRFGRVHRQRVLQSPNITTLLHANATEIETNESARIATGVRVATLHGNHGRVRARYIVLALGGIENPRLLLLSRSVMPSGLGNHHDLVGRFFAEHLYVNSGQLRLRDPRRHSTLYSVAPATLGGRTTRIEAVLSLAERTARRESLQRCAIHFPARWRTLPGFDSDSGRALAHLFRELRLGQLPYNVRGRLRRIVSHPENVLGMGYAALTEPRGARRVFTTRAFAEQAPNPASRVQLACDRDVLGRQRAQLDWQVTEQDVCTLSRFHEILAAALRESGVGELRTSLDPEGAWRKRITGGRHHMGTTRMSENASTGVVDPDCRVHGIDNLYIAGSSVFPTVGYVNPTLTIVALALRLADHLRAKAA